MSESASDTSAQELADLTASRFRDFLAKDFTELDHPDRVKRLLARSQKIFGRLWKE